MIFFAALILLFYGNSLNNGFVMDDNGVIVENVYIHSLKYLPKVITGCLWEYFSGGCKGVTLDYRPVHSLVNILAYQISPEAWFFHLLNLFFFLIVVYLTFVLVQELTNKFFVSFAAAFLFLVHPINNEVVNWISAISEMLFAVFGLLTVIYYIRYRRKPQQKTLFYIIIFYFLDLLSKETAVVLPLIFPVIDILLFKTPISKIFAKKNVFFNLIFGIPLIIYFLMRFSVIGGFSELIGGRVYLGGFTILERIFVFFKLFAIYTGKFFAPYPLIFLHQFDVRPYLLNWEFVAYLAVFLVISAIVFLLIKKKIYIPVFSLIWFFIFLLPALILSWSARGVFYMERYLFISAIGACLAIAWFLNYLRHRYKRGSIIVFVLLIVIAAVSLTITFPRNKIWKDNLTIFRSTLAVNPNALHIRETLAGELSQRGDYEGERAEYEEILRRDANTGNKYDTSATLSNLGNYYRKKGDFEQAKEYYEKAIQKSSKTDNYRAYNNLGGLYLDNQDYLNALVNFCKATLMSPTAEEPRHNFDIVAQTIQATKEDNLIFVYMQVINGRTFKKGVEPKIKFLRKDCASGHCAYIFRPLIAEDEILLPFLIMAQAFPNELVKIDKTEYKPETGEIVLEIDPKYNDKTVTFIFPSCDGVYYEATAPAAAN